MNQPTFATFASKSLLTWLHTNLIATISYGLYVLLTGGVEPLSSFVSFGAIIAVGLAFSFPVNLILVPGLYVLMMLRQKPVRVAYAITLVFFLCLVVILYFFQFFDVQKDEWAYIIVFLLPYIIGAEISFIVVARKLIFGDLATIPSSPNPSEKI